MECVIKSREVDAFSWKHQESSVMTTSHFIMQTCICGIHQVIL